MPVIAQKGFVKLKRMSVCVCVCVCVLEVGGQGAGRNTTFGS